MSRRQSMPMVVLMFTIGIAAGAARLVEAMDLEYFNVKNHGALGNGIADDTTAINSALTAARTAGKGTVFFPAGIYNTTGSHDLSGTTGLRVLGSGTGVTVLKITHPTTNLFFSNTETKDLTLQDFSVTSDPGTRTGGWVYHAGAAFQANGYLRRSRIESIDVKYQVNGFWMAQYLFVWMRDLNMTTFVGSGGVGIKAGQTTTANFNQGAELYILDTQIYGENVFDPSAPLHLSTGIWIEDCEAVYALNTGIGGTVTNNLRIVGNAGGHGSTNHFFSQFVSDATRDSHGVYITGSGAVGNVKFNGSWFASAGKAAANGSLSANGIRIDAAQLGSMEITGSSIWNNMGTGLYIASSNTHAALTISGNTLCCNGQGGQPNNTDGIYVDFPVNYLGPVITGNQDEGEPGVGLRTSARANRMVVVGNRFASGASFGVSPLVQALNEGVPSTFVASSGAPSPFVAGRGYSFFGAGGDQDGGLFSVADGTVSIYTNSAEALQVQPNQNAVFRGSLTVAGNLSVQGTKAFVQPHPSDPGKEIQYNAVEAPTADVYFRGVVRLHRGRNRIEVPEHFRLVASGPYQVLATPVRKAARVTVVAADASGIVFEASRDVEASYVVYALRAAFKDSSPIVENTHFIPPSERGFGGALPDPYRLLLIRNGTLNPDGTTNLVTARRLGWATAGANEGARSPIDGCFSDGTSGVGLSSLKAPAGASGSHAPTQAPGECRLQPSSR